MHCSRFVPLVLALLAVPAFAQFRAEPAAVAEPVAAPDAPVAGAPAEATVRGTQDRADTGFTPTWETQKQARTYLLGIPAPRGQIVDRNGAPLAQTRVSFNLAIAFPTPLIFNEREAVNFARQEVIRARGIIGRPVSLTEEQVLKHYKNRGIVPLVVSQDLTPPELEAFHAAKPASLTLQAVYQRTYPNGALAGHILGYAGRQGRAQDGPIENNELLWPNAEGREGLEQTFDQQLQGKVGQYNISFDATGKKVSEQISIPPQPGYNIVTTLDANLQRLCEEALQKGTKRGALVIIDPNNGDILAMASWPTINPNDFIPVISTDEFRKLQEDKNIPLLPRAFRSAYPPGSTFKCIVGVAALASGKIQPGDEWQCPGSLEIGNLNFRNWKKGHAGSLNFADALTQSCNTWFYQVGMKIGAKTIDEYSFGMGLGKKTGIPLNAEAEGRIPTDEYMMKMYKRKMMPGDTANFSIGQGDTLVTPLQMAQAMAVIGNGGTLFQTRLVQQVQSIDGGIVTAYDVRAKGQVEIDADTLESVKTGMLQVVTSRLGTAARAAVPGWDVAGKTGTAQWGPKNNERTAAWFTGFVPAEKPRYAFAALYEGDANNDDVHGGTQAAPLVGRVLREALKDQPKEKKAKRRVIQDDDDDDGDEPRYTRRAAPAPPPPPPRAVERVPFWQRIFR